MNEVWNLDRIYKGFDDPAFQADLDLTDKEFWRGALQTIADQIDLFCQLVEE